LLACKPIALVAIGLATAAIIRVVGACGTGPRRRSANHARGAYDRFLCEEHRLTGEHRRPATSVPSASGLLTPHAEYLALGSDSAARASTYRALFDGALPNHLVDEIRSYLQQQKLLGADRFRSWVEAAHRSRRSGVH
jgi:hypothetical protein